eukprot:COSAG01_NODE_2881_length_6915_cov_5.685739_3_plen_362_part_00
MSRRRSAPRRTRAACTEASQRAPPSHRNVRGKPGEADCQAARHEGGCVEASDRSRELAQRQVSHATGSRRGGGGAGAQGGAMYRRVLVRGCQGRRGGRLPLLPAAARAAEEVEELGDGAAVGDDQQHRGLPQLPAHAPVVAVQPARQCRHPRTGSPTPSVTSARGRVRSIPRPSPQRHHVLGGRGLRSCAQAPITSTHACGAGRGGAWLAMWGSGRASAAAALGRLVAGLPPWSAAAIGLREHPHRARHRQRRLRAALRRRCLGGAAARPGETAPDFRGAHALGLPANWHVLSHRTRRVPASQLHASSLRSHAHHWMLLSSRTASPRRPEVVSSTMRSNCRKSSAAVRPPLSIAAGKSVAG